LNALLIQRFAELIMKIWSPHNFKGHVSPHEFMQAVTLASANKFKIVEQSDSINFLSWFFNSIHEHLLKKDKFKKCMI
jgi:U4/U6.U5 tri-snRNP-associated protein 2